MTGEPLHLDPEKEWPTTGADFVERFSCRVINLLHVFSIDSAPVVRIENVQRERVRLPRRHADAVRVVFDEKEQWKCLFFGETDRFKEISLSGGSVAYCGDHKICFAVELNAPGDAAGREQLRSGWRRHTPDVQIRIAVMRRHLPPAASRVSLGEIFKAKLTRGHTAPEYQSAVAIVGNDVIARFHLNGDRRQRFVAHSGNVKMSFALPNQILLAQIRMATLQHRR